MAASPLAAPSAVIAHASVFADGRRCVARTAGTAAAAQPRVADGAISTAVVAFVEVVAVGHGGPDAAAPAPGFA